MDKITTLMDVNLHLTMREMQEIHGMSHGSVVALQRCRLCKQNGCARTERQESAAVLRYMRLAARKEQGGLFFEEDDHRG